MGVQRAKHWEACEVFVELKAPFGAFGRAFLVEGLNQVKKKFLGADLEVGFSLARGAAIAFLYLRQSLP